jgi:hypothetical protein
MEVFDMADVEYQEIYQGEEKDNSRVAAVMVEECVIADLAHLGVAVVVTQVEKCWLFAVDMVRCSAVERPVSMPLKTRDKFRELAISEH